MKHQPSDSKAQIIPSKNGDYVGIFIRKSAIKSYITEAKMHLGCEQYALYAAQRRLRDGAKFHLTLISPIEYKIIDKQKLEHEIQNLSTTILEHLEMIGVGAAYQTTPFEHSIYIVVKSTTIQNFRKNLGLAKRDLHITLGFKNNDIHEVNKDETTLIDRNSKKNR